MGRLKFFFGKGQKTAGTGEGFYSLQPPPSGPSRVKQQIRNQSLSITIRNCRSRNPTLRLPDI